MSTDETPAPADPQRRRTRLILGIAAGVLVVLAMVAGIWAGSGRGAADPTPAATSSRPTPTGSPSDSPSPTPTPTESTPLPTPAPEQVPDPGLDFETEIETPFQAEQPVTQALVIRVPTVEAIEGTADEPGEIAGPALKFVVEFVNASGETISLRDVAINVDYGPDRTPANELNERDVTSPLPAEVAANSTASGTYVFNVPADQRDQVRLTVFTTLDDPVVAFSGPAPR